MLQMMKGRYFSGVMRKMFLASVNVRMSILPENCILKRSNVVNSSHEEEVEDLTQELSSAHGNKYSYAQYKLWARMIINKQHSDRDHPPNIPMIMELGKKAKWM